MKKKMKKLKSNGDTLDRLSALPDSLILEILSFLEMRDVVRTTLLSKRWKYLWITIPCLQFDERGDSGKIRNFVSRVLTLWRGNSLRKFSIKFSDVSLASDVDLWVLFANERKVEELCILSKFHGCNVDSFYCPSQCLYECSSIRKLLLCGCNLRIRGNVQWDRLNSLELRSCFLPDDVFDKVFASSTQLETVTVTLGHFKEEENLSIRSSSLKKLTVFSDSCDLSVMTIWAPNLESWKFKGESFTNYLLTNVSSLTKVHLNFWDSGFESVATLSPILSAIQHVVTVELAYYCVELLGLMIRRKYPFSPLLNVKSLRVGESLSISELVGLLQIFPKLKTFIIDWDENVAYVDRFKAEAENYTMSEANILNSNLLQLRTVQIIWNLYENSIFQFIECLLKHAPMIKKLVIEKRQYEEVVNSEDLFLAAQKVVSLQRSFPSVEMILCKNIKKYYFRYSD